MKLSRTVVVAATAVTLVSSLGVGVAKAETITAGGASFPANIIDACRADFPNSTRFNPQRHAVDYSSVGSGSGRRGFYRGEFIFGMSDSLPSTRDVGYRDTGTYQLVPMIGGAIGVAYRLDTIRPANAQVKLDSAAVAKIFAGQIKRWNDASLRALNPGVTLPNLPIKVVYRQDTSGTTNNFANYLNKVQPTIWTKATNDAFTSAFPGRIPTDGSFQAAAQNDGVANVVADTNGAVTYAEESFIAQRAAAGKNIKAAALRNGAGEFVTPSPRAAAAFINASRMSGSTGIVTFDYNTTRRGVYPITAISYAMANKRSNGTAAQNEISKAFINFFLVECAPAKAAGLGYTALTGVRLRAALALAARVGT